MECLQDFKVPPPELTCSKYVVTIARREIHSANSKKNGKAQGERQTPEVGSYHQGSLQRGGLGTSGRSLEPRNGAQHPNSESDSTSSTLTLVPTSGTVGASRVLCPPTNTRWSAGARAQAGLLPSAPTSLHLSFHIC